MRTMLTSRGTDPGDEEIIGDGVALAGVGAQGIQQQVDLVGQDLG